MACVAVQFIFRLFQGFAQPAGRNAVARLQAKLNAFIYFLNAVKTRPKRGLNEG